jgi:hypothetical protein
MNVRAQITSQRRGRGPQSDWTERIVSRCLFSFIDPRNDARPHGEHAARHSRSTVEARPLARAGVSCGQLAANLLV